MEEADSYNGNDDEWDEDFPQYDVDLEEQFGSLETAEAVATTDMENVSSGLKGAERSYMDARRILSSGWSGCFRRIAINDTTCRQVQAKANLVTCKVTPDVQWFKSEDLSCERELLHAQLLKTISEFSMLLEVYSQPNSDSGCAC